MIRYPYSALRPNSEVRPFLRWVGGKTHLVKFLVGLVPHDIDSYTYWEPFLGAGSLFFALRPRRAVLSDCNTDLIACFIATRERPDLISRYLLDLGNMNSKDDYSEIRARFNRAKPSISKASMFIYLNKTSFNGIWRVNKQGEFNVPYGYRERPALPRRKELIAVSEALKNARLIAGDYQKMLKKVLANDFVYLDPPYPPINNTSNFTHYTRDRFDESDHVALAKTVDWIDGVGARFLMSNADTKLIRSLYSRFRILERNVTRWIRTDGKRYQVREIFVHNYKITKS